MTYLLRTVAGVASFDNATSASLYHFYVNSVRSKFKKSDLPYTFRVKKLA